MTTTGFRHEGTLDTVLNKFSVGPIYLEIRKVTKHIWVIRTGLSLATKHLGYGFLCLISKTNVQQYMFNYIYTDFIHLIYFYFRCF